MVKCHSILHFGANISDVVVDMTALQRSCRTKCRDHRTLSMESVCSHFYRKITNVIFSYTGLPQVKLSQKVLGGYFLTHTVGRPKLQRGPQKPNCV